jgi:hypothetical protein
MSNGSSIPGAKPPAAPVNHKQACSTWPIGNNNHPIVSPQSDGVLGEIDTPKNRTDEILNRPTSEIIQEAGAVASWAIEDSKTVGGLGVTLLTVCALIATSPWSWISMLLIGPARVWAFFYVGVIGGFYSALGLTIIALLLVSVVVMVFVGWVIVRAFT